MTGSTAPLACPLINTVSRRTGRALRPGLPSPRKLSRQRSEYEHGAQPPSPTATVGRSDSAELQGRPPLGKLPATQHSQPRERVVQLSAKCESQAALLMSECGVRAQLPSGLSCSNSFQRASSPRLPSKQAALASEADHHASQISSSHARYN